MCKYQEALEYFGSQMDLIVRTKEHADTTWEYTCDLQELIDKQEKYRWHDLRVNPKDLPQTNEFECVVAELWEDGHITYDIMSDFVVDYDDTFYPYKKTRTIGWKYIERFEDE